MGKKEIILIQEINNVIKEIEDKKLLGEFSFYYVQLFKDYVQNPKVTYKDLSKKYNISLATINRDLVYTKKCITMLLKEKGVQFPKNRKAKFKL